MGRGAQPGNRKARDACSLSGLRDPGSGRTIKSTFGCGAGGDGGMAGGELGGGPGA